MKAKSETKPLLDMRFIDRNPHFHTVSECFVAKAGVIFELLDNIVVCPPSIILYAEKQRESFQIKLFLIMPTPIRI